ncbi:MAG TPA: 4'-phosphopantetheinyl transferase superfamily protein [Gemmatimonadaceae bacterium]|jgi:4'-phosphopantetheinyl transferase EntD
MRRTGHSWTPLPLSVSIAHRDGVAIAAAYDGATLIGVDIERPHAVAPEHSRYFRGPRERDASRDVDATLVWVLKEAAWKALGLRNDLPFTALELDFARDTRELRAVSIEGAWIGARAHVIRLSHPRELLAAVLVMDARAP